MARDFNAMAARLAEYRKSSLGDLLQAHLSMQAAIDSLPDPVVIFASEATCKTSIKRRKRFSGSLQKRV